MTRNYFEIVEHILMALAYRSIHQGQNIRLGASLSGVTFDVRQRGDEVSALLHFGTLSSYYAFMRLVGGVMRKPILSTLQGDVMELTVPLEDLVLMVLDLDLDVEGDARAYQAARRTVIATLTKLPEEARESMDLETWDAMVANSIEQVTLQRIEQAKFQALPLPAIAN